MENPQKYKVKKTKKNEREWIIDARIIHEVRRRLRHLGCHSDFIQVLQSLNDGLTAEDVFQMLKSLNDTENLPETPTGDIVYFKD